MQMSQEDLDKVIYDAADKAGQEITPEDLKTVRNLVGDMIAESLKDPAMAAAKAAYDKVKAETSGE